VRLSLSVTWSLREVNKYLNIMPPPIIPKWSGLQSDFGDWKNNFLDAMEGDGDKSGLTTASLLLGVAQDLHDGPAVGVLKQELVRLSHVRRAKAWSSLMQGLPDRDNIRNWVREAYSNNNPPVAGTQPMDVTGAWAYLIKTYDVPPTASQVMNLVAWWASFEIDHIGSDEMTITNTMTALQLHNSKIPLDQRYSPGQVAERLMSAVGKSSMQLLNECNNEIDAAPDMWTYKIATTDPTTGVVTYVRDLFGIVAWLNRSWGDNLKAGHIGRLAAVKHLKNPLAAQEAMAARRGARVHCSFAGAGLVPADTSLSLQSLEIAGVGNAVVDGLSMDKVPMIDGLCNNCFSEAHPQAVCPSPIIRRSPRHKELVAAILDKKKAQPLKFASRSWRWC